MTDAELLAEVERHWRHWAAHLGLQNVWVSFEMMKPDEEDGLNDLTVTQHRDQYLRAYVYVHTQLDKPSEFPLSRRVLHEMCHVKYRHLDDHAVAHMGKAASERFDQLIETECDDTASIIWRLHQATDCRTEENRL